MLLSQLFENKHMTEADIASVNWNTDSKQHKLNEFAPGAGGDDEAGDDPYKYPKPKRYNRSADYFEQFEADHFDREDFDDDTGVFKGYWGSKQIAYFKFDNPARTGGNNSGMGWYYEPQLDGRSDNSTASPAVDNADERKQQELDMIRAFLKSGNRPNPDSQIGRLMKKHGMTEGAGQQLSVQQLAAISDEALDKAYGYGRSTPGNTFGWQANLKSAQYAKQMIDKGVTDIEAISDAIHKGWNTTAQAFVQNPEQFDDTAKLQAAGKLEAKLQQRAQLMKQNYAQLPDEEKEKDRVVARALLQALKGQQGVAEGMERAVDAKGRTQSQWIQLVKAKFPDGKMIQAKMPDGPVQVTLPDGRKLGWKKVEQIDEIFNPSSALAAFLRGVSSVAGDLIPAALAGVGTAVAASALVGPLAGGLMGTTAGNALFQAMQNQQNRVPGMLQKLIEKHFGSEAEQTEFSVLHAKNAYQGQSEFRWRGKQWPVTLQKDEAEAIIEKNDKYWLDAEKQKEIDAKKAKDDMDKEPGVAEGDISQLEKDVADAPVEPIANMEAKEKVGNMDADAFDAAMARLKKLAGAGPMKTVWDPAKRVYKNVPTAVQPKK